MLNTFQEFENSWITPLVPNDWHLMPHLWCLYRYTSQSLPMYSCWTAHPTSDGCFQQPCDKAQSHLKTIVRRAVTYRSGVPNILTPAQIWTPRGFFPQTAKHFLICHVLFLPATVADFWTGAWGNYVGQWHSGPHSKPAGGDIAPPTQTQRKPMQALQCGLLNS